MVLVSDAKDRRDFVYLIVTNTGTFLESLKRVFQGEKDESTLLNALKADAPSHCLMTDSTWLTLGG